MANNPSQIVIRNVQFAYVSVFEPSDLSGKYEVRILIPKNSPQLTEVKQAIQAAVTIGADKLKGLQISWENVIHDGDTKLSRDGKPVHPGHYYINAKSNSKPGIVKANNTGLGGKTMEITDPTEFYSGCYGAADVNFFAFNQGVNRGISCGLNNILKIGGENGAGDGPRMGGGRASAESVFGAVIDDDELS